MKTSKSGIELIKSHEGLRLKAYRCPANVWTIGYGHTRTAKEGMVITNEEAESLLKEDLAWAEKEVNNASKIINQNQFDALVSFVFNVGIGNFRKSTLRRIVVTNPNYHEISGAFAKWNKARDKSGKLVVLPGLTRRRKEESELYFTKI